MSGSGLFELIFEGPADDSAETLRKLRTSLLADVGLSVMEAQEILKNAPRTVKTATVEEELKPLYAALKRAGGKVLLVRPAPGSNEKAYFLNLDEATIDDDLLKSLEELPGEETSIVDQSGPRSIDLTAELSELPLEEASPQTFEPIIAAPDVSAEVETPSFVEPVAPLEIPKPEEPTPEEPTSLAPPPDIQEAPARPESVLEFANPEPEAPVAPPPPPPGEPVPTEPLFEFGPPETPKAAEDEQPPPPNTFAPKGSLDELSLSLDEPEPVREQIPPSPGKKSQADFSMEELSSSLAGQLEDEVSKPLAADEPPAGSALSVDGPPTTPAFAPTPPPAPQPQTPSFATPVETKKPAPPPPEASLEEEQIEEIPEELPTKTRRKNGIFHDILFPIAIGAIILGIANWMYFSNDNSAIELPEINIPDEEPGDVEYKKPRREPVPTTEKSNTGARTEAQYTVRWTVVEDQGNFKRVTVEVTTPAPPELSAAQIVRGEKPTLWMRKIEVLDFPFEKQLDGSWLAKGPARIFLEQGESKRRLVGNAEIRIPRDSTLDSVVPEVSIVRGLTEVPTNQSSLYSFEPLPNGDIQLGFRAVLKP